jgi:antitoxin (DNA-binding transcriptional repressor) of toxin-antitoxin stability system
VSVNAEESPSWVDIVRRAEHGDTVAVVAHGEHIADIVPAARPTGSAKPSKSSPTPTWSAT